MIQTRPRAVVLSLFAVLSLSVVVGAGCSGGGGDDDDDDDGAQCTPLPQAACTPLPDNTLTTLQTEVFGPSCGKTSCHNAATHQAGLVLSSGASYSRTELLQMSQAQYNASSLPIADPGNSAGSMLHFKLTTPGTSDGAGGVCSGQDMQGSQMPNDAVDPMALCQSKIDSIEAWIDAGALDN